MRALLWFLAVPLFAQTELTLNTSTVLLNDSQARNITVKVAKGEQVQYTLEGTPAWLRITSANQFKTPDTLYFQLTSAVCGDCTATVTLSGAGITPVPVTVRFSPTTLQQTQLTLSTSTLALSGTQSRPLKVDGPKGSSVAYTLSKTPDWLKVTSTNQFKTPDTLYFQLANASCGDCTAKLTLAPEGSTHSIPLTVTYNINAASSYKASPSRITLTYPAPFGMNCGAAAVSGCKVALSSSNSALTLYSAKVTSTNGDNWLMLNNVGTGFVSAVPIANGLTLTVNPQIAATLSTGVYRAQVAVYDAAKQNDLVLIDVALMLNPGTMTLTQTSGAGASQTLTLQFPHPGGYQELTVVNALINSALDPNRACFLGYEISTGTLMLMDDQGNDPGQSNYLKSGSTETVSNSQCTVRLESVKTEGTNLTLAIRTTFRPTFSGSKKIYVAQRDRDQNNSGWQVLGTWDVKAPAVPPKKAPPKKK